MVEPGFSRIKAKAQLNIHTEVIAPGTEVVVPDSILLGVFGALEGVPEFDLIENGHAQYRASQGEQDAPKAPHKKAAK